MTLYAQSELLYEFGLIDNAKLAELLGLSLKYAQRLMASDLREIRQNHHGLWCITAELITCYQMARVNGA